MQLEGFGGVRGERRASSSDGRIHQPEKGKQMQLDYLGMTAEQQARALHDALHEDSRRSAVNAALTVLSATPYPCGGCGTMLSLDDLNVTLDGDVDLCDDCMKRPTSN